MVLKKLNTDDLIDKLSTMPIEKHAVILDSLIKSFHQLDGDAEKEWFYVAAKRLEQIRAGKTKTADGDKVFEKIFKRYSA